MYRHRRTLAAQWRAQTGRQYFHRNSRIAEERDWPEKTARPLLWEAKGLGGKTSGYSSVSVADGKIITMGSFPNARCRCPAEVNQAAKG